jgi:hypothetical protein
VARPISTNWARAATVPGQFTFTAKTFENLENWIRDNQSSADKAAQGIDVLTRLLIGATTAAAQSLSYGPVAPNRRSNPALAYRVPVQRISGDYFAGWTMRRVGRAHYILYNNTREAWFIEEGINMRGRSAILKRAVLNMLKLVHTTNTGNRFAEYIMAPRRTNQGSYRTFAERLGPAFAGNSSPVVTAWIREAADATS